jgi:hypothetical protein
MNVYRGSLLEACLVTILGPNLASVATRKIGIVLQINLMRDAYCMSVLIDCVDSIARPIGPTRT